MTGFVHSVIEDPMSDPKKWIIKLVSQERAAAGGN